MFSYIVEHGFHVSVTFCKKQVSNKSVLVTSGTRLGVTTSFVMSFGNKVPKMLHISFGKFGGKTSLIRFLLIPDVILVP